VHTFPENQTIFNEEKRNAMQKKLFVISAVVMLASLVLAACGSPATPTTAPTGAPAADSLDIYLPDAVSGDIVTAGSSTVFPLTERMVDVFKSEGFPGEVTIDSIGTGAGFERFCKTGETDVSNASRPIKDSETENCTAIGRTPVGFQVGIDALAVAVSSENTFIQDLTLDQLALIFSSEVTKWNEVNPEWPAEDILRYSPGTDSGTFDYFVEAVMNPKYVVDATADAGNGEEQILNSANIQFSEDDNTLVQGVEGSPYAIGYFGFAYYQENTDRLKAATVEGVTPDAETAESGEYPLARPLFIYSDPAIMQAKPQVAAFILFYLENVNDEVLDVGYFPVSDAKIQEGLDEWYTAMGIQK
jgi:phosphate transport system substrate-binding protein